MSEIDYHQPFCLLPNRVWRTYQGGLMLDRIQAVAEPQDSHFPEDWVGSATRAVNMGREHLADEGIGRALDVDGQVFSMEEIYATDPAQALGAAHARAFGARPYLLVKLLDSAMRLHLQAHPSVSWARRHLDADSGKTEAWWILGARDPDPWVYIGFQHPPTPAEWRRLIDAQDIDAMRACCEPIPVAPGDLLLIEGGVPHAIGPGLFMVEIQEPTDYVVRCEYAHGGLELPEAARTMGLGLDRVLDLFDYTRYPRETVKDHFGPRPRLIADSEEGREESLLAAPQTYRIEVRRVDCAGRFEPSLDGRFSILIVLDGQGCLTADGVSVEIGQWSRLFLPAVLEEVRLEGNFHIARCLPPLPTSSDAT